MVIMLPLFANSFNWRYPESEEKENVWIDPDTPTSARTTTSYRDGGTYELVMSDEFNEEGRDFSDGHDPRWTAIDRPDTVNDPLEYYKADMVTTTNGFLNITTINKPISWTGWNDATNQEEAFRKHYRSGMVQGFNKFCFTGGIVELSVQLPGPGDQPGLWPAAWLMGNLGRATWKDSTNGMWPYSFDHCMHTMGEDVVGQNPSAADGQRISACNLNPEVGLHPSQGRGVPEIDIFEAMAANSWSGFSASLQVAPPIPAELRPTQGQWPQPGQWYSHLKYANGAQLNIQYYGAPGTDALSANYGTTGSTFYSEQHVFRLEWVPGEVGYVRWYVDGKFLYEVPAASLAENYMGMPSRMIPNEPMYLIFNTAMANNWSPLCNDWNG